MQTKGCFLFTKGPPTGPSISLALCLPSRTKPPSWALKERFSTVNILRGLSWHPEKRLEWKGASRISRRIEESLGRTLGRRGELCLLRAGAAPGPSGEAAHAGEGSADTDATAGELSVRDFPSPGPERDSSLLGWNVGGLGGNPSRRMRSWREPP